MYDIIGMVICRPDGIGLIDPSFHPTHLIFIYHAVSPLPIYSVAFLRNASLYAILLSKLTQDLADGAADREISTGARKRSFIDDHQFIPAVILHQPRRRIDAQ